MNRRVLSIVLATTLAPLTAMAAPAVDLNSITFPERQAVALVLTRTDAAPAKATAKANVEFEAGQARIEVSYSKMQPAVLFGGDIASYVVWAVSRNAAPQNLGELIVEKKGGSGKQTYTTGRKDFAIMVTAEPYYLVARPCELVIFNSAPAKPDKVSAQTFKFDAFRPGPKPANPSIAEMTFEDKTPVPVLQAESAVALIDRYKAGAANPEAVKAATVALGEAKAAIGGNSKAMADAARRSISSTAEAMRAWGTAQDEKAAADAAAKRAAETAALEGKASAAQAEAAKTAAALSTTEAEKAAIAKQRDEIAREREKIRADRDALAAKLQGALGQVADTKQTARGTVTSLSGVLFDTGKSTLKPDAKITLAKLAGIMLVFSKTTMQIEGYTDNTGTDETNLKLSDARATAVKDFLASQGIAATRMTSTGKGPADPVAPNDTPDGRSKNRRVEVISSEPSL